MSLFLHAEEPQAPFGELVDIFSRWQTQKRQINPATMPQLTFYTNITNLWWHGQKSNVLAIAEQRLACNSNDIAGLILKMEYDMEFVNLNAISNSTLRVIGVGQTIQTDNYKALFPFLRFNMQTLLDLVAVYPEDEIEADRAKALLPEKHLSFENDLLAVCLDGLVTNFPALPQSGTTAP